MLSHGEARAFYDRLGSRQDWQRFYEDRAVEDMVANAAFEKASDVFELGCGTGRLAQGLLDRHLPPGARYLAVDLSETMSRLAARRLSRFGSRVVVCRTDGSPRLPAASARFDRFVSAYVLDLLTIEDIESVLAEAGRLLRPSGTICLVSLTRGFTRPTRAFERVWTTLHRIRPALVGGCRPIELEQFLSPSLWEIRHRQRLSSFGVPSEIVVAEKTADHEP